jgi:hypothetical protein
LLQKEWPAELVCPAGHCILMKSVVVIVFSVIKPFQALFGKKAPNTFIQRLNSQICTYKLLSLKWLFWRLFICYIFPGFSRRCRTLLPSSGVYLMKKKAFKSVSEKLAAFTCFAPSFRFDDTKMRRQTGVRQDSKC